ncbi:MAG: selenide, water dikinase SelD, partial [Candidatus Binatia bacterium]
TVDGSIRQGVVEVAFDPQTSGGLLIALPQKHAPALVAELQASGLKSAAAIGYATSLQKAWVRLV